ncbi:MAG: putative RME1A, RME-1/EHD family protein, partial [Streblomastix strix]
MSKPRLTAESKISTHEDVIAGLKQLYRNVIKPLEQLCHFELFHSLPLKDGDFDANPVVLLLGQYSVGKTTFINYLLGRDYPGQLIGPEPTTDRFVAVYHGNEDKIIPGNTATMQPDLPFGTLEKYGSNFLSRFQVSMCGAKLLESITLIDTPGVLSGAQQRMGRAYNFRAVVEWFASKADLILLLFDAHKLDISDEFRDVIEGLTGFEEKVRVVLNKADGLNQHNLMRVYGALLWSLSRAFKTPEVIRVYCGSFWNGPTLEQDEDLFDEEQDTTNDGEENQFKDGKTNKQQQYQQYNQQVRKKDSEFSTNQNSSQYGSTLQYFTSGVNETRQQRSISNFLKHEMDEVLVELSRLPRISALRRVNELVRRTRLCRAIAALLTYFKQELPIFGKDKKKQEWLNNLPSIYHQVSTQFQFSVGDFPPPKALFDRLNELDFNRLNKIPQTMFDDINKILTSDLPHHISLLQISQSSNNPSKGMSSQSGTQMEVPTNPFALMASYGEEWNVNHNDDVNIRNLFLLSAGVNHDQFVFADTQTYSGAGKSIIHASTKLIGFRGSNENLPPNPLAVLSVSGNAMKDFLTSRAKLPIQVLSDLWRLSDIDKDGKLIFHEFIIAMHLLRIVKKYIANNKDQRGSYGLPPSLPVEFIAIVRKEYKIEEDGDESKG